MVPVDRTRRAGWVETGLVYASVEDVWRALLNSIIELPVADKHAVIHDDSTRPFTTTIGKSGEGRIYIEADKRQHRVTIEGEWWYRGVLSVEPHQHGSLLVYSVFNMARGFGWWIAQLVQGPSHARAMRNHLQQRLNAISSQLACEAYLTETDTQ